MSFSEKFVQIGENIIFIIIISLILLHKNNTIKS